MPVQQLTLTESQQVIANLWGTEWSTMAQQMSARGLTPAEMASPEFLRQWSGGTVSPIYAKNGETILAYNFRYDATSTYPGIGNNSNTSIVSRGTVNHAPATAIETVGENAGKVRVSRLSGLGSKLVTGASKIATPLALASIGITLGKTIDETLYNVNPDFWDDIGLETLNPQTWSSIAGGDDTIGGTFLNALFGIDPDTGETQAYMSADAMAYLAYCMQEAGVFGTGETSYDFPETTTGTVDVTQCLTLSQAIGYALSFIGPSQFYDETTQTNFNNIVSQYGNYHCIRGQALKACTFDSSISTTGLYFTCVNNLIGSHAIGSTISNVVQISLTIQWVRSRNEFTIAGAFVVNTSTTATFRVGVEAERTSGIFTTQYFYGANASVTQSPSIEGIGNQEGATLPNFDGLTESEYLPALQQQYPDLFNNAINYPVVQPDGTVKNYQYVPITLPNTSNPTDTQPTSGNQSQAQPSIDPNTATDTLTDLLTKLLQQPMEQPITDTPTPPENPTDTGEGSSPVPVAPTGSASSLWKIYHPTQAQVDSFGAWLWSPDFIDQVLKIFNNPMESIIGLHKIYATPIDAGTSTIHVGYLDSEVPSAYVEQQYVDVDCGTVNLSEQFGNALDYIATDVKLYLPFVGIVPLNVNEVMRSSVNVTYGVDVLTGACLARVKVSRDGNSSIMYQYSGNCAVQYPISSGSYMGIVSSILGIAGSVAATVATGGGVAPLAIGAASAAMGAHTSVQNSGNFSGNAGAMGGKIPYLIVERAQSALATDFPAFEGYPANDKVKIGNCSGFVRGKVSHIVGVSATDTELDEIAEYIASGILV